MATKNKQNKRSRKQKSSFSNRLRQVNVMEMMRNDRFQFIIGLIIAFFGVFIMMAIISHFFTGEADQSKILNERLWNLITNDELHVDNWVGPSGAYIALMLVDGAFGIFSLLVPIFLMYLGLRIMRITRLSFFKMFFVTAFSLIFGSITSAFILDKLFPDSPINWGGAHGTQIERLLENSVGWPGVTLLILLFIVILFVIFKRNSMYKIQDTLVTAKTKLTPSSADETDSEGELPQQETEEETTEPRKPGVVARLFAEVKYFFAHIFTSDDSPEDEEDENSSADTANEDTNTPSHPLTTEQSSTIIDFGSDSHPSPAPTKTSTVTEMDDDFEVIIPEEEEVVEHPTASSTTAANGDSSNNVEHITLQEQEDYDPRKDLSSFHFPGMDLLKVYNTTDKVVDMDEQNENKNRIITVLRDFGIEITSIKATVGPTITLYEIVPKAGIKVSKIRNLEDDIALSLSALGIRIIAPMPGKGTVGIEVPNKEPQIVSMHSVIASKKFVESTMELPVALGKTITNEVFMFDVAKMPHLLVAGATGQGKSVGLNAIITSLLYKKHPAEMKMVLVDPKMVEFSIYSRIEKHYLAKLPDMEKAIITDVTKVTETLNSLTQEMDNRYALLMKAGVRNIKEYNEKFVKRRLNPNNGHMFMPYIVVVIDEFGDLIMTAGKEIEMPIARIAQKARAVGMHMIIATQRPTTNIITGTIKANFPARMAFRVTSQIDSRTILDRNGAEQLIGRGDMLFTQGNDLIRIQCAFVDTPEVDDIAKYIGTQVGYENAFALPEVVIEASESKAGSVDLNERDALFEEAARLIVVHQQGSTSLIQRKFSIGYNRAGRLMDQLEAANIVGPAQGSKPRDVYVQDEYSLEKLFDSMR